MLTFLHLSDIHCNQRHMQYWDPDEDLRRELLRDLPAVLPFDRPVDAVLVTGDIAFSGRQTEYQQISPWLADLARLACGDPDKILTVPGNHDVDRSRVDGNRLLVQSQQAIRDAPESDLDQEMEASLRDPGSGPLLREPMAAYQAFAHRFGCDTPPTLLWWDRVLPLGQGYSLRIRGVTSVLVTDQRDDENAHRLAVPVQAFRLPREPNTVTMLLAHHPPLWMRQRDAIAEVLDARVNVQLFGHRHVFNARPEAGNLALHAGAANPGRGPGWQPHYNLLTLDVVTGAAGRPVLRVTVRPRRWYASQQCFGVDTDAEGNETRGYDLVLPRAAGPVPVPAAGAVPGPVAPSASDLLTGADLAQLTELLVALISSPDDRQLVHDELPTAITGSVQRSARARTDVHNLLRTFQQRQQHQPWTLLVEILDSLWHGDIRVKRFTEALVELGLIPR